MPQPSLRIHNALCAQQLLAAITNESDAAKAFRLLIARCLMKSGIVARVSALRLWHGRSIYCL